MLRSCIYLLTLAILLGSSACSKQQAAEEKKKGPSATLVSIYTAQTTKLEATEETVGSLEGLIDPTIAAEVPGRVLKVLVHPGQSVRKGDIIAMLDGTDYSLQRKEAQAEVARVEALLANQGRTLERNQTLVQKNFISQNALDDVATQQTALKQQLDAAKARLASIEHTGSKTTLIAPVDGIIEKQIVAPGDYVKIGDPLVQIVSKQRLRAHLPFPESIASKLQPGLKVRLTTPTADNEVVATIRELKPLIGASNRSVDVIADVVDQPGWQPGASVNGSVILGEQAAAVIVPEQSVVLRPAGEVVYIIKDNQAEQRIVKTGLRQAGKVQIIEGLESGETIAVDGAAFLSDKAKVKLATDAKKASKADQS